MYKLLLSVLFIGILVFCFSRDQQTDQTASSLKIYQEAEKIFREAEQLSSVANGDDKKQARADILYQQALEKLKQVARRPGNTISDSLAFFTYARAGYIEYYFDSTDAAKKDYLQAIAIKEKLPFVADSFLFSPLLFTGAIYYTQNQFDSALAFYKKAEKINDQYKKPLNESQRLYNRLGVMYYETGNYKQARNYFEKAIAVLTATNPANKTLLANYQVNIASLSVKLEEYTKARSVYESLLPYNIFTNEINHNLGIVHLKLKNYPEALDYFKKVNYLDDKKTIDLYYNLGAVYTAMNETDSADLYFHKALAENLKWNGHKKNTSYGLLIKYQGDELLRQQQPREAAAQYQQAIIQFTTNFSDPSFYKNPEQ